ncbi:hypothetical protein ACFQNF_17450, partial [Iodobacter arcticus]
SKEGRPDQHEGPSLRIIGSAKKAARSLPRYPFSETPSRLFLASACFKGTLKSPLPRAGIDTQIIGVENTQKLIGNTSFMRCFSP